MGNKFLTEPKLDGFGYSIYHLAWLAADWVYPPVCAGCGQPGSRWCASCASQTTPLTTPLCPVCGAPVRPGLPCKECEEHPPKFDQLRSWAAFAGPLREALHSLKYRKNLGMGEIFSQPLAQIIITEGWEFDIVIPVPLGKEHHRQRGFNQAQIIAYPVALRMNKRMVANALIRTKETSSQVNLSPHQRYENLKDAFSAIPAKLKGRKVLLVDDVATTGATLNSCAETLRSAGVEKIYCLTVAKALRKDLRAPES